MTMRVIAHSFAGAFLFFLSGCGTATIDDAVPEGAFRQPISVPLEIPPEGTGSYPNLNVPPQTAAPQLTPEQKEAETNALRARRQLQENRSAASSSQDNSAELRQLGNRHAEDALKQIEGR
jgi:hypothetical protein